VGGVRLRPVVPHERDERLPAGERSVGADVLELGREQVAERVVVAVVDGVVVGLYEAVGVHTPSVGVTGHETGGRTGDGTTD